jgi:hypothetical protein
MISIPDPRDTPLLRWAAELSQQDPDVPFLLSEQGWQTWAQRVVAFSTLAVLNLPNPLYFKDWRGWAIKVKEAANVAG